jgi:hypothetical protein
VDVPWRFAVVEKIGVCPTPATPEEEAHSKR